MYLNYCEKCGKPKTYISILTGEEIPCLCDCEKKRRDEENAEERKAKRMERVFALKDLSLLGDRFADVRFDGTETGENKSFDAAFARCVKYCENADEVYAGGYGIYLYGDKGTGKTHLAACIVNELTEQLRPAIFTNFSEIAKMAMKTPALFEAPLGIDFLVIDDIGAQRVRSKDGDLWAQEKLYEVVNFRYNEQLPTIFTSNYSIGDLMSDCGIAARTVDRIAEMSSAILKITGESRRLKARKKDLPF